MILRIRTEKQLVVSDQHETTIAVVQRAKGRRVSLDGQETKSGTAIDGASLDGTNSSMNETSHRRGILHSIIVL